MSKIEVTSNIHSLLNPGSVVLVSSGDETGEGVFAVTWNMPVKKSPTTVAIESSQNHHSYKFIKKTGEFAINIPHAKMVDQVMGCGSISGKTGVDKFEKFSMTRESAKVISAPLVEEAFANIECKVVKTIEMDNSALLIAEVVYARVDENHFVDGKIIFDNGLELLHHLGGTRFTTSNTVIIANKP